MAAIDGPGFKFEANEKRKGYPKGGKHELKQVKYKIFELDERSELSQ